MRYIPYFLFFVLLTFLDLHATPKNNATAPPKMTPFSSLNLPSSFYPYQKTVNNLLHEKWDKADKPTGIAAVVILEISPAGKISNQKLELSSGNLEYDKLCLESVSSAVLPPPPKDSYKYFKRLRITFQADSLADEILIAQDDAATLQEAVVLAKVQEDLIQEFVKFCDKTDPEDAWRYKTMAMVWRASNKEVLLAAELSLKKYDSQLKKKFKEEKIRMTRRLEALSPQAGYSLCVKFLNDIAKSKISIKDFYPKTFNLLIEEFNKDPKLADRAIKEDFFVGCMTGKYNKRDKNFDANSKSCKCLTTAFFRHVPREKWDEMFKLSAVGMMVSVALQYPKLGAELSGCEEQR